MEGAVECIDAHCGEQEWQAEKVVVSPLGYGTMLDLTCPAWVLDTKTKDGDREALEKMKVYESYWMQEAAGIGADRGKPRRLA